jgi:quinol---cytochrome-c reductase cytochrome b subunit
VEKVFSFDDKPHHVLRLPYQQPFITSLGRGFFVFLVVLFFAGGDDVIAVATGSSVVLIRILLFILVFVAPAVTFVLVYLLCRRIQKTTLDLECDRCPGRAGSRQNSVHTSQIK